METVTEGVETEKGRSESAAEGGEGGVRSRKAGEASLDNIQH